MKANMQRTVAGIKQLAETADRPAANGKPRVAS